MLERDVNELKYSEIVKLVESLDGQDGAWTTLKIAFLRNITVDPVVPYIKYLCYQENLKASIHMGDYDNVMREAMDNGSPVYRHSPELIIVSLKLETLAEKLVMRFLEMSTTEINEESGRIINFIDNVLSEIRKNGQAVILVHNFEIPVYPSLGVLDYQERSRQANTIRKINRDLLAVTGKYESVYLVDVDLLQSTLGYVNFIDNRYWHIGKAPYTREACKLIAREYMKFIRALKGKNRKCLVLDCDNTLWGGIIGEDGINKIKIGATYPGSAYQEFQKAALNLYHRGIILAICSKNNEADVLEVLEKHPDMVLRKEHFVSMKINWNDKVANLKEIARELNIGLDSLVLADDNEFEINMVRKMLPEVKAIQLPNDPSLYRDRLNSSGLFDTLAFSEEDRRRNEMYAAEIQRKEAQAGFQTTNLDDYYGYLEMEVSIQKADEFSIPRISQLTQKTNQFNLTTRRYSESEIKELSGSKEADVYYLHLKDRFGDTGIVGVAILKYAGGKAFIDTFLLSCRVIGRGIEEVFLKAGINAAIKRNCAEIIGLYMPTKKNQQVEEFYARHGFKPTEKSDRAAEYIFHLKDAYPGFPGYFKSIRIDGREQA